MPHERGTRECWVICDESSRPTSRQYGSREAAEAERKTWEVGGYYHVRPARVTVELLGAPPQSWLTVVTPTGESRAL
jgi:hypothetical protein